MARLFTATKFSRFCWQLLALILVLFALTVSLIRGLLPQVDEVRQQLVEYVKSEYQIDIQLGELSAQWQAFGPAVTMTDLVIPPQEKLPVTVLVKQVHIKLDFWQSLLATSPRIEDVDFEGVHIALDMDKWSGSATGRVPGQTVQTDWLYKLLLKQLERFSLADASVQLLSLQHEYRPIHIRQLNWHNSGERHRGVGEIYLNNNINNKQLDNESLSLQLDLNGDGAVPDSLTGQIYLAAHSLDVGAWASHHPNSYGVNQMPALEGVVNFKAWFDVAQRSIHSGLVQFEPSWLQWSMNGEPQRFGFQSGLLHWESKLSGWELSSADFDFVTNGVHWPELEFAAKQQDQALYAYVNRVDLPTLSPLLPLVPGVDLAVLQRWFELAPEGSLGPIRLYQAAEQPLLASTSVKQLHWQKVAGIPNTQPLDLKLQWQDETLVFSLPEQTYTLDFGDEFSAPLVFSGAELIGAFDTQRATLSVPHVQLANDDIRLLAALKLDFSAATRMSLAANLELNDASNADKYFPIKAMGESLVEYLNGAITAGQSQNAQILWQGALASFPFEDNSGVFQAAFTLNNAEYQFQPDWPAVTDLSFDALFENDRMDIWINQGKLMDVVVDGAHVFIPELGEHSLLKIQADLVTHGSAATTVLQASPLADTVGETLSIVQIQGTVTGNLDISIPLYEGEAEDIRGQILFDNTPVFIAQPGLQLQAVTGTVQFVNDVVEGKGITSRLFEQPLEFSFATQPEGNDVALNVDMKGRWDLSRLPKELHHPLSGFYQGRLAWGGNLRMVFDGQGYQIQANLGSDLVGASVTLPGIFTKPTDEPRPLMAEFAGDQQAAILRVKLDKQAEFIGGFTAENATQLSYFDLILGRLFDAAEITNTELGHIKIDMTSAKLTQWLPVINAFAGTDNKPVRTGILVEKANHSSLFPAIAGIDAKIGKFDLLGQGLTELKLNANANDNDNGWRIDAKASEFEGTIDLYPNWMTQGLKVAASKFYFSPDMTSADGVEFATDQVLTNLPPIAVNVEDFRFFDKPFGKLVLQASPQASGYRIQTLSLTTPAVSLRGNGIWQQQNGQNQTELSVSLTASQFNHLSQQLGIDPGVKDAPLKIDADLAWQGAPYAFSLETLNGKVKFALGKGHLSQVSDKGARIFSLFSLDSLLRKLSLDFSDVFGQGMYFNSFTGNLQIDNGVVKTTDTEMDAIAGNMKVRGYTDLTTESLNYDIRFVPQLASSVPTVVLLSTSAWTLGLGAFALTKVLEPVIEVISEIRFRLRGTMSEPVVEELERRSKEIEIPESILPIVGEELSTTTEGEKPKAKRKSPATEQGQIVPEPEPKPEPKPELEPEPISPKPEPEPELESNPVSPKLVLLINPLQGENYAHQLIAMSEQLRRQRESIVYRIAA